jgi:acetyltransferase-like isoleucine patch superfamily enzyme
MKINFTKSFRKKLSKIGFKTELDGKHFFNPNSKFELPCQFNGNIGNPVEMGAFSYTGINFKNYSPVKIGRFCSIGDDVKIGLNDHPLNLFSTSPYFYVNNWQNGWNSRQLIHNTNLELAKPVVIGDDVWIGANACIKNGVKIGNGAVIACGAVVIENVPDFAIVGGVPAKLIKEREIQFSFAHTYPGWSYLDIDCLPNIGHIFKRFRRQIKNKILRIFLLT